ncbi:MAG: ABC transporter six-transmembrane domain-containing protein [Paracoccaceae bacterium]
MMRDSDLTIGGLLRAFPGRVMLTWAMTLGETALMALIPLFIGFAIDGLLVGSLTQLWSLGALFLALVALSVLRRVYDTRAYGTMRVEFGKTQVNRSAELPVSKLNARLNMGRELVDFLEETAPMVMTGVTQLVIAIAILFFYSPLLSFAAIGATMVALGIYALFHRRFYRLNSALNHQTEQQVGILETRSARPVAAHLLRLRRAEVQISDSEAMLYGSIFIVLLALILFNIWYATTALNASTGTIFAVISYSWDFVDGVIALPATLQHWTRLSEITRRINGSVRST